MRISRHATKRQGATVIEAAVVSIVFLMLVFGMLDLGIAVFRHHVISQAARWGARQTIVQGKMAISELNGGSWGPPPAAYPGSNPYVTKADAADSIANAMKPFLVGLDPSLVTITVNWLDGSNDPMDGTNRVQVTMEMPYRPMTPFIPGPLSLQATSTMLIAH